ncbi:MAG: TIR domain-containing protein [Pseudonocardiaceae bacterium]
MARVFISYANEDLTRAREVHRWLSEAGHEVFLDQDSRDGIAAGEQWRQRLRERLRWADAVVYVMTFASVVSSWCTAEIVMAQEWGSRLLPLRAEPDADHPLLADVHHIDLAQDPAAARVALVAALRRVDAAGGSGWPDDRCPFPGLRPFDVGWRRVFFGRAEETKALTDLVRSAVAGTALVVVGPSGCGKSSLVRAGLLPVMADEPGWRTLPPILPGADPVGVLARELATTARRTGLDWTVEQVQRRLDGGGLTPLADELLLADPDGPRRRLLVVVDQFEELLTQTPPAQRARFAALLRPASTSPVRVVATLRPEFFDQLLADPELAVLPTRVYPLRPLNREALRLVIEGPAQLVGIGVEAHLVARLVEDTDSGEALPLLAFTLAQLAEGISRGGQLSIERYEQLGGVPGALARQADLALVEAVGAAGRGRDEIIAELLRLVTVDEQGGPTRWRVRRDELPAPVLTEWDAFVARRLLSTDTDNGAVVIGVAHEAFLSAWPPLAQAITANVTALRARRAVEHAATEWDGDGRPPARLWSGGELAAAVADTGARIRAGSASLPGRRGPPRWRQVLVPDRVELSTQARDFLHAGIRRDRSRRRRATTVLSVAIILALVAAGVAFGAQRNTEQGQRIATAGSLVGDAEAARSTDLRTALLLGLAAHRLHPTGETHASLVNTLAAGPYLGTLTGHTSSVNSVAFTPDGHTLATGSDDSTVILWDLTDPVASRRLGQPLTGHTGAVTTMALAPDGRTLITGSADRTVIRWDLTDLAQPRQLGQPLTGHTGAVSSVALASDGHTFATGSNDGAVILWDVTDRAQPRQLGPPLSTAIPLVAVAFAPGGRMLASSTIVETVLWDLTDPTRPHPLGPPLRLSPPWSTPPIWCSQRRSLPTGVPSPPAPILAPPCCGT